jgi:hypothetical protein
MTGIGALALAVFAGARPASGQAVNDDAAALVEFNKSVTAYMELHKSAEAAPPALKTGTTPPEVVLFEKTLANRIKSARATAKQGDLFTPGVAQVLKRIFDDYYKRRTGRELRLLVDEVPNFSPQVNMTYPVDAAKATFPPRLSLALPVLPEDLEYRVVGTSLVLRDSKANLIIDYLANVLPGSAKPPGAQ